MHIIRMLSIKRIKEDRSQDGGKLLWRDRMGVPSKCTIVRTMGRSARAPEVLSGRNRAQNPKPHTVGRRSTQSSGRHCNERRKQLYSVPVRKAL
jgi:hypothetical protein